MCTFVGTYNLQHRLSQAKIYNLNLNICLDIKIQTKFFFALDEIHIITTFVGFQDTQVCNDSLNAETYPMMLIITCVLGFLNIFLAFSLHYFRKKAVLMSCLAVCCISALIMNWVRAPWVSWGLLVIIQSCIILIGILTTYAVEIFPTNYR